MNYFLYAEFGGELDRAPLTPLSALARLGMDPWQEAARLASLPRAAAIESLSGLIASMPASRWPIAEAVAVASRLVLLLPQGGTWPPAAEGGVRRRLDALVAPGGLASDRYQWHPDHPHDRFRRFRRLRHLDGPMSPAPARRAAPRGAMPPSLPSQRHYLTLAEAASAAGLAPAALALLLSNGDGPDTVRLSSRERLLFRDDLLAGWIAHRAAGRLTPRHRRFRRASRLALLLGALLRGAAAPTPPSPPPAATKEAGDAQARRLIVEQSIASFRARGQACTCPYDIAKDGSSCSGSSAYSRGARGTLLCFRGDVAAEMIQDWRRANP
jgi:hypothetical protein